MPRASMNPDKAKQGGGGIEAGNYRVTGARYQNLKTDYKSKHLALIFDLAVLDKDGAPVRDADPVLMPLGFGEKSLESFHPGQADSIDAEPEDVGDDVDAQGNTVYCAESGTP